MSRPPHLALSLALFALTALTTTLAFGPLHSASLLAILGAHEMGHFLMCRRHRVASTYPIFLPFVPLGVSPGTLGALIRITAPFPSRRALFDIGAAGPLAGLLVAVPLTFLGLWLSEVAPAPPPSLESPKLGTSLLFEGLAWAAVGLRPSGHDVYLHPIAIAGWFGLLITSMNLLPIGQLDGGHVAYALLGRRGARTTSLVALAAFAALTLFVYNYWFLFFAVVSIFARRHPQPIDDHTPLDRRRRAVAYLTLASFFLTFIPAPFLGIPPLSSLLR
jgi:membrane-associated protease RseP (regulator of RpoE activity)